MEREGFGLGNWLKAAGGLLFFVAGLLPWWHLKNSDGHPLVTTNAFTYQMTGLVPYVVFVGIAILTIIIETESLRLPRILVNPILTMLAAFGATVLVGIRFFKDGYDNGSLEADGYSITRGIGLYLAAVVRPHRPGRERAAVPRPPPRRRGRGRRRGALADVEDPAEADAAVQQFIAERARARRDAQQPPLP